MEYQDIRKNCPLIESTDANDLIGFSDSKICKLLDESCPFLSSAIKGAMGSKPTESPREYCTRTLCYGALYKCRFVKKKEYFIEFCRRKILKFRVFCYNYKINIGLVLYFISEKETKMYFSYGIISS